MYVFSVANQASLTDGVGTSAQLLSPVCLTRDPLSGLIYISDSFNYAIRVLDPSSRVLNTLIVFNDTAGQPVDGVLLLPMGSGELLC